MKDIKTIVLLVSMCLICCSWFGGSDSPDSEEERYEILMTETGSLQAVNYKNISVPWARWDYGQPQIAFLEEEGTIVQQGDIVARLEISGVMKVLENKKQELAVANTEFDEMKVKHDAELMKLEADLRSAEAALLSALLDSQRVTYESEHRRNIEHLKLMQARITLKKNKGKIELTQKVNAEEKKIQQAKIDQIQSAITTAQKTLDLFTVRATADGMIEYLVNRRTREKVKVGDRLYGGYPLIGLPDLTQMKALTSVNETDILKLYRGQKVSVRLDAYPKFEFDGKIIEISRICHAKDRNSKTKVFDVEILLEKSHRLLKPGMTVSCSFLEPVSDIS